MNTQYCPWNQEPNLADLLTQYRGVRDQDGWETLELTVRAENPPGRAEQILRQLEAEQRPRA